MESEPLAAVLEAPPRRFPRYPEYKDSGIEWVRNIPAHWKLSKVKYLADYVNGYAFKPEDWDADGLPIIRIQNLTDPDILYNRYSGQIDDKYRVKAGDILISWSASLGLYIWRSDEDAWLNQHIFKATVREDVIDKRFFVWLGDWFIQELQKETHGSTMTHLTLDRFGTFPVYLPPKAEQCAVAAFLNRETAKIDVLVAKKEQLIELLQEKRTALITRAVTKGLDPNVPMKDSGLEWLGEIPMHWEVRPLKRVSPALTVGVVVNPSTYVSDEGVPFLYGSDIKEGRIIPETARRMGVQHSEALSKSRLQKGDLVMVRVGAPGVTAVVPLELEGANCASILIIRGSKSFDPQWLCYALNSRAVRHQVEIVQYGAAQEQFNVSHAVQFLVPCPPADEQSTIATALDHQTAEIDALMGAIRRGIDRLTEFRTALISAAVTGKIDVREGPA